MKLNAACDSKLNPIALKTIFGKINCEKFFEMGILDHLTCLLRNLHAGQEATVKIGLGTTAWFKIEKGVYQGCVLSPYSFNIYAVCVHAK